MMRFLYFSLLRGSRTTPFLTLTMASMMALFLSLPVSLYGQSEAKKTSSLAPLKKMSFAQIVKDSKDKHRKNALGSIRLEELKRFPMGKFYIDTSTYEPALLEVLTKNPKRYSLLVFGGFWWCPDTKTVVGKFLFYLEKTGWKSEQISFIGLDHEKKGANHLEHLFHVTRVPTFILLDENGKEKARMIEYGTKGDWEKELADLMQ